MFNTVGEGTNILSTKTKGDVLDILGPLGNGFNYCEEFNNAIVVAGGLGVAPFPYLIKKLGDQKNLISFVGGRTKDDVVTYGLKNINISTDDGSEGFEGTVIDLMYNNKSLILDTNCRIFGCGPNVMLRALKDFCIKYKIDCEVSIEGAMACGFGICQGCPIESSNGESYKLICKDGPVFNAKEVVI